MVFLTLEKKYLLLQWFRVTPQNVPFVVLFFGEVFFVPMLHGNNILLFDDLIKNDQNFMIFHFLHTSKARSLFLMCQNHDFH